MKGRLKIVIAMMTFGSIAILVRKIDLPSSVIALLRGIIGSVFLFLFGLITRQRNSIKNIKENALFLVLSGAAIGFNWILLFESYKYTTVSIATLCYYFAPVIVMILSPFILKEKLSIKKLLSITIAMIGLFMVINPTGAGSIANNNTIGILYGLSAAVLYASVILLNKFIRNLSEIDSTLIQLLVSVIVLTPYVLFIEKPSLNSFEMEFIPYIMILGVVYTGMAYLLYFSGIRGLKGQTIAMLSYIDPITALIISFVFLKEQMDLLQLTGGILLLGSTLFSEYNGKGKTN